MPLAPPVTTAVRPLSRLTNDGPALPLAWRRSRSRPARDGTMRGRTSSAAPQRRSSEELIPPCFLPATAPDTENMPTRAGSAGWSRGIPQQRAENITCAHALFGTSVVHLKRLLLSADSAAA